MAQWHTAGATQCALDRLAGLREELTKPRDARGSSQGRLHRSARGTPVWMLVAVNELGERMKHAGEALQVVNAPMLRAGLGNERPKCGLGARPGLSHWLGEQQATMVSGGRGREHVGAGRRLRGPAAPGCVGHRAPMQRSAVAGARGRPAAGHAAAVVWGRPGSSAVASTGRHQPQQHAHQRQQQGRRPDGTARRRRPAGQTLRPASSRRLA